MTKEELWALFALVRDFVFKSGGDGDGWIITNNVENVSELFDKWQRDLNQNRRGRPFPNISRDDDCVSFAYDQESVTITSNKDIRNYEIGNTDIIIESVWLEDLRGNIE